MTKVTYSIAIVGAGAVGLACAVLLKESSPSARVLLLDRDDGTSGATAASVGLAVPFTRAGPLDMCCRARASYARWMRDPLFGAVTRPVDLYAVGPAAAVTGLAARAVPGSVSPCGIAAVDHVKGHYPDLAVRGTEQVARCHGCYQIDGLAFRTWVLSHLDGWQRADVWFGSEVVDVTPHRAGWQLATAAGVTAMARHVVWSVGPWICHRQPRWVSRALGLTQVAAAGPQADPVRVKRVAALECAAAVQDQAPAVIFPEDDLFVLPGRAPGTLIASFYRDSWLPARQLPRPGGPTGEDIASGVSALESRSQTLASAVTGGRAFYDTYVPSQRPVIRSVAADSGARLAVLTGCNGNGLSLAPAIAVAGLAALPLAMT
jgi:glycine/D-amino acid oxidase-like deaminating enzyme